MIALPVTAQSTEPSIDAMLPQTHAQRDVSHSAFRSPPSERDRNFTPSISPLSTTSRAHNDYFPDINRTRASPTPDPKTVEASHAPIDRHMPDVVMCNDDDDGSSSLSDFEGNFEDQENNHTSTHHSPPLIEEADSEAETERLGRTPQKPRKDPDIGRTPSRLNQETTIEHHLSDPNSSQTSPGRDLDSPSPSRRPSGSPSTMAGQKRKRSPLPSEPDSPLSDAASDSEEIIPLVRTNGSSAAPGSVPKVISEETIEDEVADEQNEHAAMAESARETPEPDEADENPYISPMKAARLKGKKQKVRRQKEPAKQDFEAYDEEAPDGDDMQDDDDSGAKGEEDRETKRQAQAEYTNFAEKFQVLRAKLQGEKLAAAEAELEQLNRPQPTHPDYLAQLQCITKRQETKVQQEYALARYKRQALQNQTLAERAQLHTQYYQESRETREDFLDGLGKDWYDIQKERRQFQADQADKYTYKYPTKFSDQIRNQANYNREVSILSGIQRHVGFPAAPEIHGSRPSELDDDLRAMKIPRLQQTSLQHPPVYQNHIEVNGMPARTAQEKWVEQNPWANAQHPSHQQSRTPAPFPAYAPYHTQPPNPSLSLFRQGSAQGHRTNSPFSTPLPHPQKRAEIHTNGLGSSDTIGVPSDPPSSLPAHPPNTDKIHPGLGLDDGSPLGSLKVRPAIHNPLANREDRRNFSNISSASTIDAPNDTPAEYMDRSHHPYAALTHDSMPSSLHVESSTSRQPLPTSLLHAQHGKHDERRPELYESVNFRHHPVGAYGTPVPLFANGSPARQESQRAT